MNQLTPEQAYQNIDAFMQQALGAGLFKTWNDAGIAQQSLLTIKDFIATVEKEKQDKNDK